MILTACTKVSYNNRVVLSFFLESIAIKINNVETDDPRDCILYVPKYAPFFLNDY